MRTLCPNFDREDGLETVLEVPIPEETFGSSKNKHSWQKWMRPHHEKSAVSHFGGKNSEIQLLLGVVGAPLVPIPIRKDHSFNGNIKAQPIEASMAKYIVQQYIAAAGGDHALNAIDSMYAMGKVKMATTEVICGETMSVGCNSFGNGKVMKMKSIKNGPGEMGGFVLWQKKPDLWSLELVVSAHKISVGCDGKMAWRQTPWNHSHASRGPARPLRRALQGLDPRSTANLFSNSICIGEKTVNEEDCFVLKLEADSSVLRSRSSSNVEIIRHIIWGYFSQRTGLLVKLEDSHIIRIKSPGNEVFWETTMESLIQDYRTIDGVNIAHGGRTSVSLVRYGEDSEGHTRTQMEEVWSIEEVDFNIKGLSMDCFLPPSDIIKEEENCSVLPSTESKAGGVPFRIRVNPSRANGAKGVAKVAAVDEDVLETVHED